MTNLRYTAALLTATGLVREKERGTLEQLLVSPARPIEIFFAKIVPTVLITLVAMVLYRQIPDLAAVAGLSLIVAGVVVLNLFSNMQAH